MGTLNPYEPPNASVRSISEDSLENNGLQLRLLPRSFWFACGGFVVICAAFLVIVLFLARVDRHAISFIGLPLWGLFLAPFVAVRAKLCERYQHRCMGSSGVVIFLACLGVCFGLAYASMGIAVFPWMFLSAFMTNNQQSSNGLYQVLLAGLLIVAVVIYLKLIDLSARRPTLKQKVVSS